MGTTTPIQTCHCFGGRQLNLPETEGWAQNHWYRGSEVRQLLHGQRSHQRVHWLPLRQEQPAPYLEALRTHSGLQCRWNSEWGWFHHWGGGPHLEISESFRTDTIHCHWLHRLLALLLTIYRPLSTGHCAQYQWFYYNAIVIDCNWL